MVWNDGAVSGLTYEAYFSMIEKGGGSIDMPRGLNWCSL